MAYCANCGNALVEGQQFCPACGQRTAEAEASAPPVATPPPVPATPPATPSLPPGWSYTPEPPSGPGGYPSAPGRRSLTWLWITIGAVVVAAAVACVLVFAVFHDDIFNDEETTQSTMRATVATTDGAESTTEGATSSSESTGEGDTADTPEEAVRKVFEAMSDKDIDAYFALFDPVALEEALAGLPIEDVKEEMGDSVFDYKKIEFEGLELSTEMNSDTTATVTVVEGTVTITDAYGVVETEDVTEAGESIYFDVIERDGAWYLDPITMFGGV
jgi:hypothetical protein